MDWHHDLYSAPKELPSNKSLIALLSNTGHPEAVRWAEYPEDVAETTGQPGYWEYQEDLVNDVTGGIAPAIAAQAQWTIIELPGP